MAIFYDIIFLLISLIYAPIYFFKGKFHRGLYERLGFLPRDLKFNRPIWIHAVSVGEVITIKGLLIKLRESFPNRQFVISTVTPAGNKVAKTFCQKEDQVIYLPFDFSFIVKSVLKRINPEIFVIAETELWPNLILSLARQKTPIVLINGRISDRSVKKYLLIKKILRPVLEKISFFCVQTPLDLERFVDIGAPKDKVICTGNMKFDNASLESASFSKGRDILRLNKEDRLWVAGSTHPQEEEIILEAYLTLKKEFSKLTLLIAPRHPERSEGISEIAAKKGLKCIFVSKINNTRQGCNESAVFILDTIGELNSFYAAADLVFVGGSLVPKGGHNILEPAAFGKPIIIGPWMFNFRDIAELFIRSNAVIVSRGKEELEKAVSGLLGSNREAAQLGSRAQQLIAKERGATLRNLEIIKRVLN